MACKHLKDRIRNQEDLDELEMLEICNKSEIQQSRMVLHLWK